MEFISVHDTTPSISIDMNALIESIKNNPKSTLKDIAEFEEKHGVKIISFPEYKLNSK